MQGGFERDGLFCVPAEREREEQTTVVGVRVKLHGRKIGIGHDLEPHRRINAGAPGVHAPVGHEAVALLAGWFKRIAGISLTAYRDHVFTGPQMFCDVEAKRRIAATVDPDRHAV